MAEPAKIRPAPTQTVEETALSTRISSTTELAPSAAEALAQHEVQGAIILARKFPRNEDQAYQSLMRACERPTFAEGASYSFPRGGTAVEGPSVKLAREAARLWGNILVRLEVLRDDEESRHIRAVAWDLQTNARHAMEDQFQKLIFRKKGGWVKPDERDLRELTNRRGAILERNCILKLLPPDMVEEACTLSKATMENTAAKDPDGERKKIIRAFSQINVSPEQLEEHLEHKLSACSPAEIADLRQIFVSIRDGNSTWADYTATEKREPEKGKVDLSGVKGKDIGPRDEAPKVEPEAKTVEPASATEPAPATEADYDEIELRAKKKGKTTDDIEDFCMKTFGRAFGEITHDDANALILWLSSKG